MRKVFSRCFVVLLVILLLPAAVYAQAALTGVVKDASGGVLPGVMVEATSPVLIERIRSTVSDDSGQYRIVDLRPGTYSLTFSLTNCEKNSLTIGAATVPERVCTNVAQGGCGRPSSNRWAAI